MRFRKRIKNFRSGGRRAYGSYRRRFRTKRQFAILGIGLPTLLIIGVLGYLFTPLKDVINKIIKR